MINPADLLLPLGILAAYVTLLGAQLWHTPSLLGGLAYLAACSLCACGVLAVAVKESGAGDGQSEESQDELDKFRDLVRHNGLPPLTLGDDDAD